MILLEDEIQEWVANCVGESEDARTIVKFLCDWFNQSEEAAEGFEAAGATADFAICMMDAILHYKRTGEVK